MDEALRTLALMVSREEKILWCGKPNKTCTILETIFNPLLIFAIAWGYLDMGFFKTMTQTQNYNEMSNVIIIFFLFHLMPIWLYLYGVLTSLLKYRNAAFIVTDVAVYVSSGTIIKTQKFKTYGQILNVCAQRGFFDFIYGVGDIFLLTSYRRRKRSAKGLLIYNVKEFEKAHYIIQSLQSKS